MVRVLASIAFDLTMTYGNWYSVAQLSHSLPSFMQIQTSVKTCDQFLAILKARVSAEEVHYKNLAKISTMEFTYCESTLQASMDQLLVLNLI